MKTLILHLSDTHIDEESGQLLSYTTLIKKSLQTLLDGNTIDFILIAVTGDIVESGRNVEYENACLFFDKLSDEITHQYKIELDIIAVPGNHDCNHSSGEAKLREVLIKAIQSEGDNAIDNAIIENCCKVQADYFKFSDSVTGKKAKIIHTSKLLNIYCYEINGSTIIINAYNSAWISRIKETPSALHYPINKISGELFDSKGDLVISLIHHPVHWNHPQNLRDFRNHLEKTSDLILTGHEHISTKGIKDDLEEGFSELIEGSVFYDSVKKEVTGFNAIIIDTIDRKQKVLHYAYERNMFISKDRDDWIPFKRSKRLEKNKFILEAKFCEFLNDPGAKYTHRSKANIVLEDIFVFPLLRKVEYKKEELVDNVINSQNVLIQSVEGKKILFIGDEKSGKTSLLKMIYKDLHRRNLVPVYISGDKIDSSRKEDFHKVLTKHFSKQYSDALKEDYLQLDIKQKVILIDDYDKSKLNLKHRNLLLKWIKESFATVIISGSNLLQLEETIFNESTNEGLIDGYDKFRILEFGHQLRDRLINKWITLGCEQQLEDDDLIRNMNVYAQTINIIIGRNFIPSHPIFLLTILQTIETATPINMDHSLFGYYYEVLITQALAKVLKHNDVIEAYFTYVTELAYVLFDKRVKTISRDNIARFHEWYCKEYKISPGLEEILDNLQMGSILQEEDGSYSLKYPYVYYYFVARYIAVNITKASIKDIVKQMCQHVYQDECANIIMFVTHLSKDPFILDQLLLNASKQFSENNVIKFENDIEVINRLTESVPRLVLESRDIIKERERKLKEKDEIEASDTENKKGKTSDYNLSEDASKINELSRINLAFKTIEILGQIAKKYYGSIRGEEKVRLVEEIYNLGLRCLMDFFVVLERNSNNIVKQINELIKQKNLQKEGIKVKSELEKDEIEDLARKVLFGLSVLISYAFIKKISESVGSERLNEIFEEVLEKNPFHSVRLIDISIKLDFIAGFPYDDVEELKKMFEGNPLATTVLKQNVISYLYMYKTSYGTKQKICDLLGIPIEHQRAIDQTSTISK